MTTPTPYHVFRVAVVSGLLGSVGATVGWIIWLAIKARDPELLTTVLVGAALGLIVNWVEHYIHTAKHEKAGNYDEEEEGEEHVSRPRGPWSLVALAWATGFGFLGLASEHLVSHMIAEFLIPFLASMATLLPAGVILGICLFQGRQGDEKGFVMSAFTGAMIGAIIAIVTAVLWGIGWGTVPVGALLGWWVFVGLGMRFATPSEPAAARFYHPVLGVFLALAILLGVAYFSSTRASLSAAKEPHIADIMVLAEVVAESPGLPAEFWREAEEEFDKTHPPKNRVAVVAAPPNPQPVSSAPAQLSERARTTIASTPLSKYPLTPLTPDQLSEIGKGPGLSLPDKSAKILHSPTDLKPKTMGSYVPGDDSHEIPNQVPVPGTTPSVNPYTGFRESNPPPGKAMLDREDKLGKDFNASPTKVSKAWAEILVDMEGGMGSEFARSWLVLLLFAIGLGAAPHVEEKLRPADYPSSRTFRMDLFAATFLAVSVIGACIYLGVSGIGPKSLKAKPEVTLKPPLQSRS